MSARTTSGLIWEKNPIGAPLQRREGPRPADPGTRVGPDGVVGWDFPRPAYAAAGIDYSGPFGAPSTHSVSAVLGYLSALEHLR